MTRVLVVLVLALLAWVPQTQAAEIVLTLEWTEPTFEANPLYESTMFRFTRIRWSPVACLDQPPPGVREEQRGQWTHCGFGWPWSELPSSWQIGTPLTVTPSWKVDVPASSPAGGAQRAVQLVIPDANLAWAKLWIVLDFFYGNGFNLYGWQSQEVIHERTPTGELTKPPTVLTAPVIP